MKAAEKQRNNKKEGIIFYEYLWVKSGVDSV